MEILMFFSLLLLFCSVSAEPTETEILEQPTVSQQPFPEDIHAVLRELTASQAEQKEQISVLQKENQVKQVAFSVSLHDRRFGDTGPFNTQIILIFKHVVTNIGNAYNPNTGIFTAPVRGAYHFEWHINGHGNIPAGAVLFRKEEHIFIAYENPASGYLSASNGASLLLEAGDQVSLRLWAGTRIRDTESHGTTFSGHLLFTM